METYLEKRKKCSWRTFDGFNKDESKIWSIELNHSDWKLGTCSCQYFIKNYYFKHLIGLSARAKLPGCVIDMIAKQVPLGQKRRRGAPPRAKKALIVQ